MGRVVGEGFRIGNSCTPMVDSCQCMAKPIQYCKVKKLKKKSSKNIYLFRIHLHCGTAALEHTGLFALQHVGS